MNKKFTSGFLRKSVILLLLIFGISSHMQAQRIVEKLNRGLVATRVNPNQVYINWRMLGTEPTDVSYNLYCNGKKVAESPFTTKTNFTHETTTDDNYYIRAIVDGKEEAASETANV
ncbi:hypothetical protein ACSV4D_01115 [Flavobacterium sp. ARAG 55.4]|uniref:rhamnogalacturonan endolyase family protein n=1 Tax=Flavobacterium sp. ARAG 55.4 TaxID=3451357 RepID=UPI003F4592EC